MEAEIVVSIAFVTGLVLIVNQVGRVMRVTIMHRTIREAITRNSDIASELLDRMEQYRSSATEEERDGLILLALGAAIVGYGLIQGDAESIRDLSGTALFPLFVGVALFIRARIRRRSEERR